MNIDAYNRSCYCASDVDNGNVIKLTGKETTAGRLEAWTGVVPSTGNGLTGLWMVYEPEIVTVVSGDSKYRGLNDDPRNFYNLGGSIFSVFKPQLGDEVLLTADALYGSVNLYVNATNTGGFELAWAASNTGSILSLELVATTYISLATGGIDDQRETAYQFVVVGL
jgi:hypothetical protein